MNPPLLFRQAFFRVIVTTAIIIHYCNKRGEAQLSPATEYSYRVSVNNGAPHYRCPDIVKWAVNGSPAQRVNRQKLRVMKSECFPRVGTLSVPVPV